MFSNRQKIVHIWMQAINQTPPALTFKSQYHIELNKFTMRFPVQTVSVLLLTVILYSCSSVGGMFQRKQQVYQPPRLGAEYRFEDGLRKQKNPQELFSKKERKEMEKMGRLTPQERSAPNTRITAMQADSILTGKTRDTATVQADSALAKPADSLQRQPVDTTRH